MQNPDITIGAPSPSVNLSEKDIARFWSKVDKNGPTQPHMNTPCWTWTDHKRNRYGSFRVKNKKLFAHRISWIIFNGQIPQNKNGNYLCVCHHCDNPSCCRIEHLFVGTHADNAKDKTAKGRNNAPSGDRNGSRLHPERLARGDKNGSRLHPEKLARGNDHGMRKHPERRAKGLRHGSKTKPEKVPKGSDHGCAKLTNEQVQEIRDVYKKGGIFQKDIAARFGVTQSLVAQIIRREIWKHLQ